MSEFAIVWRVALYAILIAAAIHDMRRFLIPNYFPIAILVLLVAALVFTKPVTGIEFWIDLLQRMGGGAIAFIIGFAVFVRGIMGGGDAKLYAALGFWFGLGGLLSLTLFVALAGSVVGIGAAMVFFIDGKNSGGNAAMASTAPGAVDISEAPLWRRALRSRVPYGLAICLGAIIAGEIGISVSL